MKTMNTTTTTNTTKIVANSDHFAVVEYSQGKPTILGSTTWMKGLCGPVFIEGGRDAALAAAREKMELGYMPSFF
jgi:hypothetical protein